MRGLTIESLFLLRRSIIHSDSSCQAGKPNLADELSEWVEGVDGLSMLLWISCTLQDQEQMHVL